jgi:hypothetical protein
VELIWTVEGVSLVTGLSFHSLYPLTDSEGLFIKWTLVLLVVDAEGWVDGHSIRGEEKDSDWEDAGRGRDGHTGHHLTTQVTTFLLYITFFFPSFYLLIKCIRSSKK